MRSVILTSLVGDEESNSRAGSAAANTNRLSNGRNKVEKGLPLFVRRVRMAD